MDTKTITNGAIRSYKLPKRTGRDGTTFGARTRLRPGQRLIVPAWYFAELLKEKGWKARLDPETGLVRGMRGGVGRLFEERIKQQREARAASAAQERAVAAEGQVSSLEKRLNALERDRDLRARATTEAEERAKAAEAQAAELKRDLELKLAEAARGAKAAEARVAELERQLGAPSKDADAKTKDADTKPDPKSKK